MILRGSFLKRCLCIFVFTASIVLADPTSTPKPADSGGAHFGAVQDSLLQYLYDIPRKPAASDGQNQKAIANSSAKNRRVQSASTRPAMNDPDGNVLADDVADYPPPYYRESHRRLPESDRSFSNYRYFGGQPGRYGYDDNRFDHDDAGGDIYRFGFNRGYDRARFDTESNERTEAVLQHFSGHLAHALTLFNQGRYREAVDGFRLAADEHQGDPSSRIYAAHALFAVGRYHEAVGYIRRAFELQPRIVFLSFDMRNDYGQRRDFTQQLGALESALQCSPSNVDRLLLLGYVKYYSGQRDQAYDTLLAAYKLNRRDPLVKQLMDNCHPADVMLDARKK